MMAHQADRLAHRSRNAFEVVEQVSNAYGHLTPPDEDDPGAHIRVYGRCLVDTKEEIEVIQQRLNTLENASVLVPSPKGSVEIEQPSQTSDIEDIRERLREMDER